MANATENPGLGERINEFVQKNRRLIFAALGIIAVLLAGSVAALSIMDVMRKKATAEVEELNRRYESLRFTIAEETSASDVKALLDDLDTFARKTTGYAGGKAWSIMAGIHGDKKEWAEAETAWTSAAAAAPKTYLAPLAWFNAGAAAEEQGRIAEAIDYYTKSVSQPAVFPSAPHAQFSIGRLQETQNDTAAAIEAYRAVISNWPADTVWTSLAHSRIIALEGK
ncbi:MAG: tetratricopeptide repeat protein [Treponema sp.]|jgi:tetratricopeptide (TPR) repeat protein|nr:tetratricopeptide repeat protein [Treponema sp.]